MSSAEFRVHLGTADEPTLHPNREGFYGLPLLRGALDLANETSRFCVACVKIFHVSSIIEDLLDHFIDSTIANKLGQDHSLVDAITDERQRKVLTVGLDLGREAMNIAVLVDVLRCIKEYRSRLIEYVRDLERRMTRENSTVNTGHERFERNPARSVSTCDLFFDFVSKIILSRRADLQRIFF